MKLSNLSKLAMFSIAGGAMVFSAQGNGALASEPSGMNSDELLSALSWTCRKAACNRNAHYRSQHDKAQYDHKNKHNGTKSKDAHSNSQMDGHKNGETPDGEHGAEQGYRAQANRRQLVGMKQQNGNQDTQDHLKNNPHQYNDGGAAANESPKNEEEFVRQLDSEGRRLYNSLSEEGKKLAMRLAKQYADKDQAVKHASQVMAEQKGKPGHDSIR